MEKILFSINESKDEQAVDTLTEHKKSNTHPLTFSWTLWTVTGCAEKKWGRQLKKISTFDTVQGLWNTYNALPRPTTLKDRVDYYLFKEHIKPMWEDKNNSNGGRWLLMIPREKQAEINRCWMELMMAVVGEQFGLFGSYISGITFASRYLTGNFSIWTKNASDELVNKSIGDIMYKKLGVEKMNLSIWYTEHPASAGCPHTKPSKMNHRLFIPSKPKN